MRSKIISERIIGTDQQPSSFWKRKVPVSVVAIILFLALVLILWQAFLLAALAANRTQKQTLSSGFSTIKASAAAGKTDPEELQLLKQQVTDLVKTKIYTGHLRSAGVYVQRLNDGKSFEVNGNEGFTPGSLLKVPVLIYFLKRSESEPGFLDKMLWLDATNMKIPQQTFAGKQIDIDKPHSIRELLYYTAALSDNYATMVLNYKMEVPVYERMFGEMGVPVPDMHDIMYTVSAVDFSKFFSALYNSSYINAANSEYALSLLVESDFTEGMLKALPPGVKLSHKFGEFGRVYAGALPQLHESGLVYLEGNPFLITIMTKGESVKPLPGIVGEITRLVYEGMKHPGS